MKESNNLIKHCEICNSEAKSLCFECFSYFCDSCFKFVHEKSCNNDHKKEEIDYLVPIDLKCQQHPKNIINLYCVEERGN